MNYEHEKGINALRLCLNMCPPEHQKFERIGLSHDDIEQAKHGEKYLTEDQLHKFINLMRLPLWIDKPLVDWLQIAGHWALAGIVTPTFSLNGVPIRGIMAFPHIFINNPEVNISIHDSLIHTNPNGHSEELFITDIEYDPYSEGYNPIYKLTVSRSKPNMQNNISIGNMSGNARVNSGYITDNSSNEIHELPADFFLQIRTLLENINENHRRELEDMLAKIEAAHTSGNKKECGKWFGQFFSLAFTADCITVLQPLLPLISWLMTNV